mmetsp:Transcript_23198/g.54809  ORF Transcript_23198/g.54809 Transcript_23198/m.54809 type:complete len:99 (+) Transcript_23198:2248-2544(+)
MRSVAATTRHQAHRGPDGGDSVTFGDPGSRQRACKRVAFVEASGKPQGLPSVLADMPFESSPGQKQKGRCLRIGPSAFYFCFGAQERTRTSTELPAST